MVVNFRVRGINRGARKLVRTPTLIKKIFFFQFQFDKLYSINIEINHNKD
jgi:hypothetical protein